MVEEGKFTGGENVSEVCCKLDLRVRQENFIIQYACMFFLLRAFCFKQYNIYIWVKKHSDFLKVKKVMQAPFYKLNPSFSIRTLSLFLLSCFIPTLVFCQKEPLKFRVLDEKDKSPIGFCYVVIKGKNVSSQSDEEGNVQIRAKATDTLVIYQLGYFLKKLTPNEISRDQNIVLLRSKNITLQEVVVSSQKLDTLQGENNIVFLDFSFYDDYILALINKGKKYNSLLLLDADGNKVNEKPLSVKAENLFKDCFGNMHVLTSDSVYQVYYNYQALTLLKPYPLISFYDFLEPCECYDGYTYIFKVRQCRNLKNTYYICEDGKPKSKRILTSIRDSAALCGFQMNYDVNYFLNERRKGTGYATSVTEIMKNIDQYREELVLPSDEQNLLRPLESEMIKIDTVFMLFDYTNKTRYHFSRKGKPGGKALLNDFSGISPKLYIDHDSHYYIFTSLDKNGTLTLYRYDPANNVFTNKFVVKDFYFIKNFEIKGNNLYFIHKDRSSSLTRSKIIKQFISWEVL